MRRTFTTTGVSGRGKPTGRGRRGVRIVVLGGAGIIGRSIVRDLADDREIGEIVVAAGSDSVESIRIYNGATPDMGDSLAWAYSIQTIFDEITQPPVVFREGRFLETEPLGEEELYRFQDPIGVSKVHLSLHSEVATLPLTYGPKGIKDCFFKISFFGYSEKALRQLQFLAQLGLASTEPVEVRGAKVKPRDVLLEVLKRAPQTERTKSLGFKDIVTEVKGTKGGRPVAGRVETTAWPH